MTGTVQDVIREPRRAKVFNALYASPLGPVGLLYVGGAALLLWPLLLVLNLFAVTRYAVMVAFYGDIVWGVVFLAGFVWYAAKRPRP